MGVTSGDRAGEITGGGGRAVETGVSLGCGAVDSSDDEPEESVELPSER